MTVMTKRKTNAVTKIIDPLYVDEVRHGRNFIRKGDTVKVRPSREGRKDGFTAVFRGAKLDDDGNVRWVDVIGGPRGRVQHLRSFPLDRIRRLAQTRDGECKETPR
jgi:hypothetical protein